MPPGIAESSQLESAPTAWENGKSGNEKKSIHFSVNRGKGLSRVLFPTFPPFPFSLFSHMNCTPFGNIENSKSGMREVIVR